MTTTQQEIIKTARVAVQEKAEVEGGILVRFLMRPPSEKEWNTKYPVPVKVDKQGADMMQLGHEYTVMLKRERLKKDRTGQYLTDYYWGWGGIAEKGMEDKTPETPDTPASNGRSLDPTRDSIERQTALKAAVEVYTARVNARAVGGGGPPAAELGQTTLAANITHLAAYFAAFIETGRAIEDAK